MNLYLWRRTLYGVLFAAAFMWSGVYAGGIGSSNSSNNSWLLSGYDITNSADSSSDSSVSKSNVNQLKLKWIYQIAPVPYGPNNPPSDPRAINSASQGAVVDKGKVYFSLFDGRIITLSVDQLDGTNPDGTPKPKLLNTFDLFNDPKYYGASDLNGDDVFMSRLPLSMMGKMIFAGNYQFFNARNDVGAFANKQTGAINPTAPNYASQGAKLYAIDKDSGNLIWKSNVDTNPQMGISSAGLNSTGNLIFVGFNDQLTGTLGLYDLSLPFDPFGGHCCDDRGGVAAIDKNTGKVVWKTYNLPKQNYQSLTDIITQGYVNNWAGSGVWGNGNFPISHKNQMVYFGTGEASETPKAASDCEEARLAQPLAPPFSTQCLKVDQNGSVINRDYGTGVGNVVESPGVNSPVLPITDGVLALDIRTGKVKWGQSLNGFDVWNLSCFGFAGPIGGFGVNFTPFCPPYLRANPFLQFNFKDLDIAEQPMLVEKVKMPDHSKKDILLVTSKSSKIWGLDASNGNILWGPVSFGPGNLGTDGILWGSANDGKRLYTNNGRASDITLSNINDPDKAVVVDSCPSQGFDVDGNWTGGMYIAVDIATGKTAWQRCVTGKALDANRLPTGEVFAGRTQAGVSVSNGVVLMPGATSYSTPIAPADDPLAEVLLLDADTGELLRSLPLGPLDKPSPQTLIYQRPIAVGNKIFISNGSKDLLYGNTAQQQGNVITVYEISQKNKGKKK